MNGRGEGDVVKKKVVLMSGYLPGASQQRSPLIYPVTVRLPEADLAGDSWKDVCGGGCGFAVAISESGKLITWGSTDDQGQSYLTSGKHGNPELFPLPTEAPIMKAAAGWAHCVSVTVSSSLKREESDMLTDLYLLEKGEVYTWGWKECVPSGKITRIVFAEGVEGDASGKQISTLTEQVSPRSQGSKSIEESLSHSDSKKAGEESVKRRKVASAKQELDSPISIDETLSAPPCLVELDPGVKITSVAAGGRHTLALSDLGQVWGWGYGGEGQLGLGTRIKMVATPHLIPCIEPSSNGKDRPIVPHQGSIASTSQAHKVLGSHIKGIACGGRHSAVITDTGALITFGWGLYGQCGHGNTNDVLRPTCVTSLLGTQIKDVAAGLWHTVCVSADGRVHAFGGNQFGQLGLGTGSDQAETTPKPLDAPILENKNAKTISCGARHSVIMTEDGKIYCWGWNKYGQLGLGDNIDRNIPSQVSVGDCILKNIACGWWHTLSLAETS